jgi:hypothetical protein
MAQQRITGRQVKITLDNLEDVDVAVSTNGDVLRYVSGIWRPGTMFKSRTVTGPSYTLSPNDHNYMLDCSHTATMSIEGLTDPLIPIDFVVLLHQQGSGKVTVNSTGTTIQSSGGLLSTSSQYAQMALTRKSITPNVWRLTGDRGP